MVALWRVEDVVKHNEHWPDLACFHIIKDINVIHSMQVQSTKDSLRVVLGTDNGVKYLVAEIES